MRCARYPGLVPGIVSAFLLGGLSAFVLFNVENQRSNEAQDVAHAFALRLYEKTNESLAAVYMLSTVVDRKSGLVDHFEEHAAELLLDYPLVRTLELAPGGIIGHVYPLRGNEIVVGHDLLRDKTRNHEVYQAISKRQVAVAGPFELRQGGVGIIARYPLYQAATDGRSHFWGLSIGVIDFPALLRAAGESDLERSGYQYQICWVPVGELVCTPIPGSHEMSVSDGIVTKMNVFQADWRLTVSPREGWITPLEIGFALAFIIMGAVATGVGAEWMANGKSRQAFAINQLSSPAD